MFGFKIILITISMVAGLVFFSPLPAYTTEGEGGYAGAYLRVGVGARPLGMGGAFTALSDDATASYWNAAGLGQIKDPQVALIYSSMSMDRLLNLATSAQPLKRIGTFGVSWLNYGVGDIDGRDMAGSPTGNFSDSENAFSLSFGKELSSVLLIGSSFKYLYQKLASQQATGYGFDVGVLLKIGENIRIGGKIQDIASKIKWDTDSRIEDKFPIVAILGISIALKTTPIRISADMEKNGNQNAEYHIGAEYWIIPSIAARLGYNQNHITAGGSVVIPISSVNLQLDYAFAPDVLQQSPTHQMSMVIKF